VPFLKLVLPLLQYLLHVQLCAGVSAGRQVLCRRLSAGWPRGPRSAKPLLRHLRKFSKTLSYGRQEDAHDFFFSLVMTMEAIQLTNYGGKERL